MRDRSRIVLSISISRALNAAVSEVPVGVIFGVHMCRGNFKGHYLGAGGYEFVAQHFFTKAAGQPSSCWNTTHCGPWIPGNCSALSRIKG